MGPNEPKGIAWYLHMGPSATVMDRVRPIWNQTKLSVNSLTNEARWDRMETSGIEWDRMGPNLYRISRLGCNWLMLRFIFVSQTVTMLQPN